ncbi:FmdB family transcriptional regulator [Arthrobacter crusticola]|uniref:FmdB family transcriptional regulator n=1 Tax=Arthrobacter crusticola TaxID=2547960 RepID=A0A4R5TXA5_9MICC|nr:FmdB family zinc ribbon protein [Arthrobacter crusticola]TDK25805.1 FmdB family transcriptional regulator [Arthrobacter crusticola]
MPTYAYACKDCGHAFDIQQAFSDESLTVCPVCSGVLRKKFNSVGVVFKGSGFYRNDSRDTRSSADLTATPAASDAKPAAAKAPAKKADSGTTAAAPAAGKAAS